MQCPNEDSYNFLLQNAPSSRWQSLITFYIFCTWANPGNQNEKEYVETYKLTVQFSKLEEDELIKSEGHHNKMIFSVQYMGWHQFEAL